MSTIDNILQLMQGQSAFETQAKREQTALEQQRADEEHAKRALTLKIVGAVVPWLIPGAGVASTLIKAGATAGEQALLGNETSDEVIGGSNQMARLIFDMLDRRNQIDKAPEGAGVWSRLAR